MKEKNGKKMGKKYTRKQKIQRKINRILSKYTISRYSQYHVSHRLVYERRPSSRRQYFRSLTLFCWMIF